jgi:DNA-binding HxlR family transcriptional regulator
MNDGKKTAGDGPARRRSRCPVSSALELLGDKWTLLLVRDLMLGKGTYSEFQQSPEGIPTNILADRLKRLQAAGIIDREPYQQKPVRYRYRLTARGRDLSPVIHALIDWSERHLEGVLSRAEIEAMLPARSAQEQ